MYENIDDTNFEAQSIQFATDIKPESMFKTKAEHLQEAAGVKNSKKDPFSNELADPQTFTGVSGRG